MNFIILLDDLTGIELDSLEIFRKKYKTLLTEQPGLITFPIDDKTPILNLPDIMDISKMDQAEKARINPTGRFFLDVDILCERLWIGSLSKQNTTSPLCLNQTPLNCVYFRDDAHQILEKYFNIKKEKLEPAQSKASQSTLPLKAGIASTKNADRKPSPSFLDPDRTFSIGKPPTNSGQKKGERRKQKPEEQKQSHSFKL